MGNFPPGKPNLSFQLVELKQKKKKKKVLIWHCQGIQFAGELAEDMVLHLGYAGGFQPSSGADFAIQ